MQNTTNNRQNGALEMTSEGFSKAGNELVAEISNFLHELPQKKVNVGKSPEAIRDSLRNLSLPLEGAPVSELIREATSLLFKNSLFNGHPRFWGYITSSASPISALADMLAATINANVGAFALAPMATEIEKQTVKWLAEMIGYDKGCGGLFVSGGNMANFIGFLAGRKNKLKGNIRKDGIFADQTYSHPWGVYSNKSKREGRKYIIYCAKGTHTWIQKAADLFGHGTDSIRWINVDKNQQMEVKALEKQIKVDLKDGHTPFVIVGNAGSVSTGSVDPLDEIADVCEKYKMWFHVDGAYGAPAAMLPENEVIFRGLSRADSIALDPHKWLYTALEAGCVLVKDPSHLSDTFSFQPEYYNFNGNVNDSLTNFHDFGMQNSRGFRALKVWLNIKQAGLSGYRELIRDDIKLAQHLFHLAHNHKDLEAISNNLSNTTFRFIPQNVEMSLSESYINRLNEKLLNHLQQSGDVYLSNAVVDGKYCLRVCIVNFRTTIKDIEALVEIVAREGKALDAILRTNLKIKVLQKTL